MRCEQIQPSLLDYSLQPSSCPDQEAIRLHLGGCENCRNVLEQERKLAFGLSGLGQVSPASDMWSVVRDRIRVKIPLWQRIAPTMVLGAHRLAAVGIAATVIASLAFVGVTQHTAHDKQNTAVLHLVEMQGQNQASMAWTDDPLKERSDRVSSLLGEGS